MTESETAGAGSERRSDEAILLVAGAVDMALEQAEQALRRVRSLLGRSDLGELAADVRRDLVARGRHSGLDPARVLPSESHVELVARRLTARTAAGGTDSAFGASGASGTSGASGASGASGTDAAAGRTGR
ncbi:hypothetical protein ACFVIM_07705 [Streptomyces sp. NPDC057638]|uniref:hypothetical protein n=1 Tax=Streptomyces sp. NPDC057638 TaxID=3346190 RepID=UPI003678E186